MRVAVFGGSFNPPHVGHLMVAEWVRWTARADAVWWVPVRGHPFSKDLAPYDDRVELCRAAVAGIAGIEVSEVERDLPTPSYTIDTLSALARRHPEHLFRLVVGADVLPDTPRWKDWPGIEARFDPIRVGRVGWPTPPGAIDFPGVSSTEVRRRVAAGEDASALVPAAILDRVRALYAVTAPG
jgi:nicotinate-nucleotide adenylyltransferase